MTQINYEITTFYKENLASGALPPIPYQGAGPKDRSHHPMDPPCSINTMGGMAATLQTRAQCSDTFEYGR